MKKIIILALCVLIACCIFINQKPKNHTIRGFDVSHHQGNIQWDKVPISTYQFVYIKATQGNTFKDPNFAQNWSNAQKVKLLVGAYHFFNLCQDGNTQADAFIATVPLTKGMLPPAIDLEYNPTCIQQQTRDQLLKNINIMYTRLAQHYNTQPIFYTTATFKNIVLIDQFSQVPLWIQDYKAQPKFKYQYWQYTSKGHIDGIATEVDLNLYSSSSKKWQHYIEHDTQNYSH